MAVLPDPLTEGCCTFVESRGMGFACALAEPCAVQIKTARVGSSTSLERVLPETLVMAFASSMSGNMPGALTNANGRGLKIGLH